MRRPFIPRVHRNRGQRVPERGVTLLLVAVAMVGIITMAGMSIDIGTLYQASAEAQRSADTAALAAAKVLASSGMTGDPANSDSKWSTICTNATQIAQVVANQNLVGGAVPSGVAVSFIAGDQTSGSDCSANTLVSFGVNPTVTVKVTQASLSTYFSRIWGRRGSSVSATATAEAFNPSNSKSYSSSGDVVPVQPRCVKPWIIPNYQPWFPTTYTCTGTDCEAFIDPKTGIIQYPGIATDQPNTVIGQTFSLVSVCHYSPSSTCNPRTSGSSPIPQANIYKSGNPHIAVPPNIEYLPGQIIAASTALPAPTGACSNYSGLYASAIAGCDQNTKYSCGVPNGNFVDMSENPGADDTTAGVECLIHSSNGNSGQDTLALSGASPLYPFQILAGANNPLAVAKVANAGEVITSSTSIVSLPIYDSSSPARVFTAGNTTQVTITGFLQVFINSVDNFGNVNVTVMNVAGCGNNASGAPLTGTSPVPVRLITPP